MVKLTIVIKLQKKVFYIYHIFYLKNMKVIL